MSNVFCLEPYMNNGIACTLNNFVKTKNIMCRAFVLFKKPAVYLPCIGYSKFNFSFVSLLEFTENTEALKTKMSELRLYCNLLVQQVHKTKEASICGVSESEVQLCFCCRPHR